MSIVTHEFDMAIFEGLLLGAAAPHPASRGSAFATYTAYDIPVYDPLNPSNVMDLPAPPIQDSKENRPSP